MNYRNGFSAIALFFCLVTTASALDLSDKLINIAQSAKIDSVNNWCFQQPQIAVSGAYVYVLFNKYEPNSMALKDILFTRSTDGGRTFEPAVSLGLGADMNQYTNVPENLQIAAWGTNVVIGYISNGPVYGPPYVKTIRSDDNGASFKAPVTIFHDSNYYGINGLQLRFDSKGNLFAAYGLGLVVNGSRYISLHCAKSVDGGAIFTESVPASSSTDHPEMITTAKGKQFELNGYSAAELLTVGDTVYLLSTSGQDNGGYGVYPGYLRLYTSTDGGAHFGSSPLLISDPDSADTANLQHYFYRVRVGGYSPKMAALPEGKGIAIVWTNIDGDGWSGSSYGSTSPLNSVRVTRVTLAGTVRTPSRVFHQYTAGYFYGGPIGEETIMANGSTVVITARYLDPDVGTWVYASADAGLNWTTGIKISGGGYFPRIGIDQTNAKKVYISNSNFYTSYDGGASFDGGVNPIFSWNTWRTPYMTMASDGGVLFCGSWGWLNDRHDLLLRRMVPAITPSTSDSALNLITVQATPRRDQVQIASTPSLESTSALTVDFWFRRSDTSNGNCARIVQKLRPASGSSSVTQSWQIGLNASAYIGSTFVPGGKVNCSIVTDSTNQMWGATIQSAVTIPVAVWTHLAMTYNGAALALYVNGQLAGQTPVKGKIVMERLDAPVVLGNTGTSFDGAMSFSDLRVWNKACTSDEIRTNINRHLLASETGLVADYRFDGSYKSETGSSDGVPLCREYFIGMATPELRTPIIASFTPATGSMVANSTAPLSLKFQRGGVAKGNGSIVLYTNPIGTTSITPYDTIGITATSVTLSDSGIAITHSKPFPANANISICIDPGALTSDGVAFDGVTSLSAWQFSTGAVGVKPARTLATQNSVRIINTTKGVKLNMVIAEPAVITTMLFSLKGEQLYRARSLEPVGKRSVLLKTKLAKGAYFCRVVISGKMETSNTQPFTIQ